MYKRLSAVMFPVLAVLLIGAVLWGYNENQEKNSILIKAENQYQRAFHDLSYHVDKLHTELGNTLAVNPSSQGFQRKGLVNAWRITSQAQSEINQLPLSLLPFNKTEEFLANIANFSYRTAVRDLTKEPLSEGEYKTLKTLYARSEDISKELRTVQTKTIQDNLRWMDVELALATEDTTYDNTIIDGFKTVDKKVSEYDEINWGPTAAGIDNKRTLSALGGKQISGDAVKAKARKYFGLTNNAELKVVENGNGTEYSSYSVSATNPQGGHRLQADFTKKGGHLVYFMNTREVNKKNLTMDQAVDASAAFLKKHEYKEMVPVSYDIYDNVAHFTFVGKQGKVLLFPEKLSVMTAMDNGEIMGLQATDYIYNHKERKLPKANISESEARKALNRDFKVSNTDLALIENELDQEVLTYEFTGRINGHTYRIYINADSGNEEKVDLISDKDIDVTE
ncbi:sporulation protein [Paenibacillus swuensis]|uniref:Sporulation protein n=1 Tax=Paenibacillus swuensis TaxID=1178515 RepID=A0A172TME6_9BACL|nr:germination protein YpeB [Paenibacillus swuensis]ANE47987.1 sporulation protein [Paenibacillus swuensis]